MTTPADVFVAQSKALQDVSAQIHPKAGATPMTDVTVTDQLPDDVAFLPASAWSGTRVVTSNLVWNPLVVPLAGAGMRHRVRPRL